MHGFFAGGLLTSYWDVDQVKHTINITAVFNTLQPPRSNVFGQSRSRGRQSNGHARILV